jgi:hypothetical protein
MNERSEGGVPSQEHREGYPEEFVAKVKAEFPDSVELHKYLDAGSEEVGHYLDDSRHFLMRSDEIIEAFESGESEKILEAAKKANRIKKLYDEWKELEK